MKRNFFITLAVYVFIAVFAAFAPESREQALPEEIKLYFFHDNVCASCDGTEEFYKILDEELTGFKEYPLSVNVFNMYHQDGFKQYNALIDELGLDKEGLLAPFMIIGGRVYSGMDTIKKNIREAYLSAGEDVFVNQTVYNPKHKKTGSELFQDYTTYKSHATAVYFYRIICEECIKTSEAFETLPGKISVDGKKVQFDLIRINTRAGNNSERIAAFFDAYNVPDEDRIVPIVFFKDGYLAGYENITSGLVQTMEAGGGLNFEFPVIK